MIQMEIFKLFGSIFVDTDKADASIKKTEKNTESFASKLGNGIKTAAKWGAAIVAAASVGVAALTSIATSAASTTDNIDKMSQKIGISREAYQELDFVCSQSGTSVDNLKAGIKTLTNQMQSAADGSEKAQKAFESLGLSWTDNTGALKDQETMMWEVMAALQSCENQTEKSALAVDLFGKAGTELMPMLNGAAGSIEDMRKQAHDLGLVLSDDAIDMGVRFTDTVDQIKRSIAAFTTQVGVDVMPVIQTLLDWAIENMPMIQGVIQTGIGAVQVTVETFCNVLQGVFLAAQEMLGNTGITFDTIMASIQDIFFVTWSILSNIWDGAGQPLLCAIMAAASFLLEHMDAITGGIHMAFQLLWDICEQIWASAGRPIFEAAQQTLQILLENWDTIARGIGDSFRTLWEICSTLWFSIGKPIWDLISHVIGEVASVVAGHMGDIVSFFGQATSGIRDTWTNHLKPVFDAIGNFLNNFLVPVFKFAFDVVIGPLVSNVFDMIQKLWTGTLKPVFDGICDFLLGVFTGDWEKALSGILSIVTGIFNGIITAVQKPMDMVRNIVDSAINFIREKFDFKWEFPSIKLPHFSIKGSFSLSPPSVPTLGIDWYAKGGILEEPTAFGINPATGNVMVGGEAGPEAVAPIETLQQYVREAVDSQNQKIIEVLVQILGAIISMDEGLLEKLMEALESFRFEIKEREFARLVREV